MSRDIGASTHSFAFECMESGRAQLDAQNSTTPNSGDILSTIASTLQIPTEGISSPSPKDTSNDSRDNLHDKKDLNEIPLKIADIILDGSVNPGRKQPTRDQEPTVKSSEQNNVLRDNTKYTSSTTCSVPTGDSRLVLLGIHSVSPPLIDERPQPMPLIVDEPDPRLIDALRKALDRPLILKVEQEVIAFINGTLDFYDTSPLNSYHRMLVHKIAEFYRLTHIVSPDAIDCVRLFRGHAARIPPMKLSDIASPKSPTDTPPSGPQLAVKIMRRKSPSQKGINGESDQTGDGKGGGGGGGLQVNDPSKPMTREEKEAAYQLARARIFGDFKESPTEGPSPSKGSNEKQTLLRNNKDLDDGFQSRSQYSYRVITQPSPGFVRPGSRFTPAPSAVLGFSGLAHSSHILNPAAVSFNPNAGTFIPSHQAGPALNQQYPVTLPHGGGYPMYPSSQVPNVPFPATQPNYNRPTITPNGNAFNSPMTQLPSGPQGSHGNAASGNSRFPPTNPGFVPTPTDGSRGYPRIGQIFDRQTGSSVTYPSSLHYFGHQISNADGTTNGIMNGGMNGGWPSVGTHTIQPQGRFQQGEGPLGNPHTGNFGPYGLGRS